jgi:hypothetical protein
MKNLQCTEHLKRKEQLKVDLKAYILINFQDV